MGRKSQETEPMEEAYEVEKIIKKKVGKDGKLRYFLKWKGYPSEENTWEPVENIDKALVAEFERARKKRKSEDADVKPKDLPAPRSFSPNVTEERASSVTSKSTDETLKSSSVKKAKRLSTAGKNSEGKSKAGVGFSRGLEPERIIGATDIDGDGLKFLMKWHGVEEADLVPAKEANVKCPDIVIAFYESRLVWKTQEVEK